MPPEKTGGGSPKLRSHGRRIELEIEPLHVIADTSGKAASVLTHPAITWQLGTDVAGVGLPKKPLGRREHRLGAVELQQQCRFVTRTQRGEPQLRDFTFPFDIEPTTCYSCGWFPHRLFRSSRDELER